MWKNRVENAYDQISLHDCIVDDIEFDESNLKLSFGNGFWVSANSEFNTENNNLRTDMSKLIFLNFDKEMSMINIFKHHYLFGKCICTTRKEITFDKLIKNIKNNIWKLEILEEYYSYHTALFFGTVKTKKKIGDFDFQFSIDCDKTEYCWNVICMDKKW